MARSLVLQEVQINGFTNPTQRSVLLMSERILRMDQTLLNYNGTLINSAQITYMVGDGSKPDLIMVRQAVSDIRASVNTANTSNNIDVIGITRKNQNGTTTAYTIGIGDIVRAYAHPESTFDSLLITENATKDYTDAFKADESVQALQTALNA